MLSGCLDPGVLLLEFPNVEFRFLGGHPERPRSTQPLSMRSASRNQGPGAFLWFSSRGQKQGFLEKPNALAALVSGTSRMSTAKV